MSEIVTFPEDSYDYSSDEVGGALAGLIVRDSLGVPRAGILPSSNQLLSGRNDWQVNVAPFIGVAVEDKVVRLGGNDGEMQTSVDEPPSSGGRVDRICWDPQMGTPVIHVVPGAPGSSPVAPTTPAGMVSLGTVRLDAGDTSTSQGLFVADFPFTSTAGGVLMVRSSGELDDWEPADGAEAFNLAEVLERSVHWVVKASGSKIKVTLEAPKEIPVSGSAGQMQQVLVNLVQNAIDSTERQPDARLDIKAEARNRSVVITFRDNGPGFQADTLAHVFDPFFTTKPVGKGTGLGLSVTHSIVGRHRGSIAVDSTPGQGTTFTLRLPLRQTSA